MNIQKPGKLFFTVLAFLVMLAAGLAPAHAVPLSELFLPGGSIIVDDKLFDNFEEEFNNGSTLVDPSLIDVTGLDDQPNNPGLKFTALGGALTVAGGDFIDFGFNFKVTVLDPNWLINDASLALTDFVVAGDGLIQIEDSVFDPNLMNLGNLFVEADAIFGNTLFDSVEFAPQSMQSMLFQEINVFVDSGFEGAPTGINMFEVRKSQIPEPAALILFGIGLVGLSSARRLRGEKVLWTM